jgi:hypothetical protein
LIGRRAAGCRWATGRKAALPALVGAAALPYDRPVSSRTTRRQADLPVEERKERQNPSEPPAPRSDVAAILALQRSAGNAAVSRAMLARAPTDAPLLPGIADPAKPSLVPGLGASLHFDEIPMSVQMPVDAYLDQHTADILEKVLAGTISVPEMVAELRQKVPQATSVSASSLAGLVRNHRFSNATLKIPEERAKVSAGGLTKQAEASIANALPSVPTSVSFSGAAGALTLSISGVQLKTKVGGAQLKVDAGKEGPSAEVKKGDVSAGASAKWDGTEFGLKTQVKDAKLDGKVSKDATKGWSWSAGLVMPLWGSEIDVLPDLAKVVAEAQGAISESVAYIQGGGSPTDSYVTDRLAKIKPSIEAAERTAKKSKDPAATLRASVGGGAGGFSAGLTLTIEF